MPPKRKSAAQAEPKAKVKKTAKEPAKKKEAKNLKSASPNMAAKCEASKSDNFDLGALLKESTWKDALKAEFEQDYFKQIQSCLQKDYAAKRQIFNAFQLTPLNKVKVVILGQDPYHDDDQAEGLAFSVPAGLKIPPSLKNIFKELDTDIPGFTIPTSGSLDKWAKQGVLLLNATLTVQAHTANSHKSYGWQSFTDKVIKAISDNCKFVVFILWGNFAHKKEKLIDSTKHYVMKDAHPSPLSFNKFKGSKCFSRTNAELKKHSLSEINWCL